MNLAKLKLVNVLFAVELCCIFYSSAGNFISKYTDIEVIVFIVFYIAVSDQYDMILFASA